MTAHKLYVSALMVLILTLFGCGNDGGGSGSGGSGAPDPVDPVTSPPDPGPSATTGSVAILIRDNPLETIDSLELTITKVELLGGPDGRFVLYEGSERIDILDYQMTEFLLAMREDVPPGSYDKIRLHIEDPDVSPNPDDLPVHQTGNGKLDLNPQGSFEVEVGAFLAIRVDMDAKRSVHVVGNNNHFLIRPLVFVDVVEDFEPIPLGDVVGTVTAVDGPGNELTIVVPDRADDVCVLAQSTTTIFDDAVFPAQIDSFEVGDEVLARGRLDSTGTLLAEMIFEGPTTRLRGEMTDGTQDVPFPFVPDAGESTEETLPTEIVDAARAWREQGSEIPVPILAGGSRALMTGQLLGTDPDYLVGLMDIEVEKLAGTLEVVDHVASPLTFTFRNVVDELLPMTLDADADISVIGDGAVPLEYLTVGLPVVVTVTEVENGDLVATALELDPTVFTGTISQLDIAGGSITLLDAGVETTLPLRPDATVLRRTDLVTAEIGIADLAVGDTIEAYGLVDVLGDPALWVVIWEFSEVSGTIDAVDSSVTPPVITVRDGADRLFDLEVPDSASLALTSGESVDSSLLSLGLVVEAEVEGLTGDLQVSSMTIEPVTTGGVVTSVDVPLREVLVADSGTMTLLQVRDDAVITLVTDAVSNPIDLSGVAPMDLVTATGLPNPAGGFVVTTLVAEVSTADGSIDAVDLAATPATVTVRDVHDRLFTLELAMTTDITLTIGPAVDPALLSTGLSVVAEFEGTSGALAATSLVVTPLLVTGPVSSVDTSTRLVEVAGAGGGVTLHVRDDAIIEEQTETGPVSIDLTEVTNGDSVEALGLPDSTGTIETWSLTVLQP